MKEVLKKLKGKLIVSCQALEDEPLHSPFIMGRMALAAWQGGAAGIRGNTAADIREIKNQVDLPVIGIVKRDYDDSAIYITPTMQEIQELLAVNPDMIAIDATNRMRPNNEQLDDLVSYVKESVPNVGLMADVSTAEEAMNAEQIGFDCISTTLIGYTSETGGQSIADNDFSVLKQLMKKVSIPVIAEGKLDTPEKADKALGAGAHFVVVGSAVTRPQLITKTFVDAVQHTE